MLRVVEFEQQSQPAAGAGLLCSARSSRRA